MRPFRRFRPFTLLPALALLALSGGCASNPPSEGGTSTTRLSGKRIHVVLNFAGQPNPGFYYYFLLNVTNDNTAPGPIPVGPPVSGQPYKSNGFATASALNKNGLPYGFTDFVLYSAQTPYNSAQAQNGFGLYHVVAGTDPNNVTDFRANGAPLNPVAPSGDPSSLQANQLSFDIDLAQLFPDDTDQTKLANDVAALHYIQVNMVATDVIPTDIQTSTSKQFDSFGDTRDGRGNYFTLDVSQLGYSIQSGDNNANIYGVTEPPDNDVYVFGSGAGSGNPQLNLTGWSISIKTQ